MYITAEFYDNNILLHAHNTCRGDLVPRRWRLYILYSFISFHFDRSKAPRVTTTRDVGRDDDRHEAISRRSRRRETRDDSIVVATTIRYRGCFNNIAIFRTLYRYEYTLHTATNDRFSKRSFPSKENQKKKKKPCRNACGMSIVNEEKGVKGTRVEIFRPRQTSRNIRVRLAIFMFFFSVSGRSKTAIVIRRVNVRVYIGVLVLYIFNNTAEAYILRYIGANRVRGPETNS